MTPEDAQIKRIAATILSYAIKDGAREIQLRLWPNQRGGNVFFRFRKEEEWQETMKIPRSVMMPLRAHWEQQAGDNKGFEIAFTNQDFQISLEYRIKMSIAEDIEGETIVFKLDGKFLTPSPTNP